MAVICPTVTAFELNDYNEQIHRTSLFANRVHIDLMDGEFAPTRSPDLEDVWWPYNVAADIHLMYQRPMEYLHQLIRLQPRMVIIHNEADVHHMHFVAELHKVGILAGLAILQDTPIRYAFQIMHSFDHVLIFSGKLGYHGGEADLGLLEKIKAVRAHNEDVEIGWDGGINDKNARQLIDGGVDVLNAGGYVQKASDPGAAYATLSSLVEGRDDTKTDT